MPARHRVQSSAYVSRRRPLRGFWIVGTTLSFVIVLVLTHPFWLSLIGGFLIVSEPVQRADTLLSLAGHVERVEYAADLFEQGVAV